MIGMCVGILTIYSTYIIIMVLNCWLKGALRHSESIILHCAGPPPSYRLVPVGLVWFVSYNVDGVK